MFYIHDIVERYEVFMSKIKCNHCHNYIKYRNYDKKLSEYKYSEYIIFSHLFFTVNTKVRKRTQGQFIADAAPSCD